MQIPRFLAALAAGHVTACAPLGRDSATPAPPSARAIERLPQIMREAARRKSARLAPAT